MTCKVLDWTSSLTKWKSRAICFILLWKTGFEAKAIELLLSQAIVGEAGKKMCKSLGKWHSQITSVAVETNALHWSSVLDLQIVACFLASQLIGFAPKNTPYLLVDLLSSGFPAHSASEYPCNAVNPLVNNKPWSKVPLTYLKTLLAAHRSMDWGRRPHELAYLVYCKAEFKSCPCQVLQISNYGSKFCRIGESFTVSSIEF